ncbi:PilN domain-containing protein [Pseudoxanthomonas sacheonensis]|uniref:PilN domain-containing protein n=1 Tax=Pseudoxanthomonas sacheonensis TaxID=443615 RepID=UPI0013D14529|nr:PilN domain-containing protein [Pseudoxanthomonas sacheonensis]KAF1712777.1 fimbrial protein [Pseudoxanthomonas sacheonensis]
MARINLLPWRAERRANRQKEFYGMLGLAAAGGLVLSFLIWFHYSQQISGQNTRNQFLQAEIQKVEGKIKEIEALDKQKDRLLARKKVIEQLQANRSQMVHLFDSLVRTIPDGVALSSIKQEGEILTLEGRAQSNARVSNYMRNLEGSGWMTNPDLSIIEAKAEEKAAGAAVVTPTARALPYAFTLQVKLANPNAPDAEGNVAVPPAPPVSGNVTAPPAPAPAPANAAPAPGATPPAAAPAAAPSNTPVEKPAPTNEGRPAS